MQGILAEVGSWVRGILEVLDNLVQDILACIL